jgi:hypothetical protein
VGWNKQEIPPDTLILERLKDLYDLGTLSLANLAEATRRILKGQSIDEYLLHHLLFRSGSKFLEHPLVLSCVDCAQGCAEARAMYGDGYFLDFTEIINRTYCKTMTVVDQYLDVLSGSQAGVRNLDRVFIREGVYFRLNPEYRNELLVYLTHLLNLMLIIVDAYLHKAESLSLRIPETFRDNSPQAQEAWLEVFNAEMPGLFNLTYRARSTLDEAIRQIS